MAKEVLSVGLLGLGTIGKGVAKILLENSENLAKRAGLELKLVAAADLDLETDRGVDLSSVRLTTDAMSILKDPAVDVVVEVIGGVNPARAFITEALKQKKHVVTSNKEVMAKHGAEFIELANASGVNIYYEAAVAGGIPIIHGLKNCLAANNVEKIFGIMNGTTNFILTKMSQEGAEFADVLAEAQALGYAEADPTSDVDGYDVAYKLSILSGIAFNSHFKYEDIYFEGIRNISATDIRIAREMGYVIKLLAVGIDQGDEVELRVHPVMIETSHPLANVNGAFNAVYVEGNYIDQAMFYGPGAGELPTASAVVGDVLDIAMNLGQAKTHPSVNTNLQKKTIKPMGDISCEYYLRIDVADKPGVLAAISAICGKHHVSIRLVQQKEPVDMSAELVIITHQVKEAEMQAALREVEELEFVNKIANMVRVGL